MPEWRSRQAKLSPTIRCRPPPSRGGSRCRKPSLHATVSAATSPASSRHRNSRCRGPAQLKKQSFERYLVQTPRPPFELGGEQQQPGEDHLWSTLEEGTQQERDRTPAGHQSGHDLDGGPVPGGDPGVTLSQFFAHPKASSARPRIARRDQHRLFIERVGDRLKAGHQLGDLTRDALRRLAVERAPAHPLGH